MEAGKPDTNIIKMALQFRAKYQTKRQEPKQNLKCWQVVPHPSNRGGEVIRSTRTRILAGDVVEAGYDPIEAVVDSVAVEIDVDASRGPSTKFNEHFAGNAGQDPDHYINPGFVIEFAGLSHNTINLTQRNISNRMPGCACETPAISLEKCSCKAKPLLDDDCKYSLNKLKKADPDWYNAIQGGTEWEILSSDMDTEAPDAAHIISLALNNKNKVAFATGHLEILRTLKQLCTPDPVTLACPYDRVRTALLKRFGPEINDVGFYNAYQLVMTSGGIHSESWKDFFQWAGFFVDESRRKIRLETYTVLAPYPNQYRHIVKMQLKHTWSVKPQAGSIYVPVPTSIAHRLDSEGGKHAWPTLMKDVEDVGHHLPELCSTVVEQTAKLTAAEKTKASVKWRAELEIDIMKKIIAAPKLDQEKQQEQEMDMRNTLAELIATKLVEFAQLAHIYGEGESDIKVSWGGDLMKAALEKFHGTEWRSKLREASDKIKADAAKKDLGANLLHKVIEFNEENKPKADVETYDCTPEKPTAEMIPWAEWMAVVVTETAQDYAIGKNIFKHTCSWAYRHLLNSSKDVIAYPLAIQKLKGIITVSATRDILPGCLVIPVLCTRDTSYLTEDSKASRSNHEVTGLVKWKQPVNEATERDVLVKIGCQPERRQPSAKDAAKDKKDTLQQSDCHPFWHIRRSMCVGEFNSAIVGVEVKVIVSSPMKELKTDDYQPESGCCDTAVTVPCIVNTEKIAKGNEIVLKWEKKDDKREGGHTGNNKRVITAFNAGCSKVQKR